MMGYRGVLAGLEGSAFLASVDARDRNAGRVVASVFGGLGAGLLAAIVATVLLLVIYALAAGGQSSAGIGQALAELMAGKPRDLTSAVFILLLPALSNGPLALVFVALAALLVRHRFMDYVTGAARVRWRLLGMGLLLWALLLAPLVIASRLFDPGNNPMPILSIAPDGLGRGIYALAVITLLIPAAAAEEILFRGWLLRQTAAFLRNPIALMAINGVVFSALHFDFQPDSFLIRTLMGAGFTYMTLRLGGIEFSTGAHAANNILIVLFIEPLTLKMSVSEGFSWVTLVEMVVMVVGSVAMTEAVVRFEPLRRLSGLRDEDMASHPVAEQFS